MGYRHQVMSSGFVPRKLPEWFTEKYPFIEFDRPFWVSKNEYKRYGFLKDFEKDIQRVLIEVNHPDEVNLVYYADESHYTYPDISFVTITKDSIVERVADNGWRERTEYDIF